MADFAAVDLGAESGRVVRGRFDGARVTLDVARRFPNASVRLPDGLRWNLLGLFAEILAGLRSLDAPLAGVGVDSWGVDYALLDERGRVLGLPFHYRDSRTDGMVERAFARVSREELYEVTGIQTMPINTVFQLLADEDARGLAGAARIALIPDLISSWLSGELVNEITNASTTGLLAARSGTWARAVAERLGLPAALFADEPVEPGVTLGPVLAHHAIDAPLHVVASHDTASAFVAAPLRSPRAAILSSGTWSLLGVELDGPVLDAQAREYNLTNERGVDGTIRLLRNVMGLWLVQECATRWGATYEELAQLAAAAPADVPVFDPDDEALLRPGDMPARITEACVALGQDPPADRGALVRSILVSLACTYRLVLERLERVTGRDVDVIHVIGGGVRNELLCALTADILGRPVFAGPVEATALGNVLVQARAVEELGSLADMRAVAAASAEPALFEPGADRAAADATYERFLAVTR